MGFLECWFDSFDERIYVATSPLVQIGNGLRDRGRFLTNRLQGDKLYEIIDSVGNKPNSYRTGYYSNVPIEAAGFSSFQVEFHAIIGMGSGGAHYLWQHSDQ